MNPDEQNRWESLRKEARQYETILAQKMVGLEKKARLREAEIDFERLDGSSSLSAGPPLVPGEHLMSSFDASPAHRENSPLSTSSTLQPPPSAGVSSLPSEGAAKKALSEIQQEFTRAAEDVRAALLSLHRVLQQQYELTRLLPATHPHHHITQRLQSVYEDKQATLQRTQADFARDLQRLQLLPSIRKDVEAFKESTEVRFMLDEQRSLRATQGRVNRILEQAGMTQEMLGVQKERFEHAANSLVQLMERVPVIKRTLGRIDAKRRRNVVCLGTIMGLCFFLVLLFW